MKLSGISYVTPMVRYDPDAKVVVVQHRNTDTGEISRQFPSQEALQDLRSSNASSVARSAPASEPAAPGAELGGSVSLTV